MINCYICSATGFKSAHALRAHLRNAHPGQSRTSKQKAGKKRGRPPKASVAAMILAEPAPQPTMEGVKYCPECGHFLLPYTAAVAAMKGRRS